MKMLDQLETMMGECEKHPENMPTMRSFLMVARVCYMLLAEWVKKNDR